MTLRLLPPVLAFSYQQPMALFARGMRQYTAVMPASRISKVREFNHVEPHVNRTQPDWNKFPILPKIPQEHVLNNFPRGTKDVRRFFGEELIHTELQLKQFGIVAVSAGQMRWKHFESIKKRFNAYLTDDSFVLMRMDPPHRPMTSKRGKRMGGGKGKVKTYGSYVKAGRVVFEVGGKITWDQCHHWLVQVAKILPFEAIAVTQDMLEALKSQEARLEKANLNPLTTEWFLRNNIMDCQRHMSPYDLKFGGKFTSRDRHNNRKWQLARGAPYRDSPR